MYSKMAAVSHISRQTGIICRETHLWTERNPYAKFQLNISTGCRGDAMTGKIQYGL